MNTGNVEKIVCVTIKEKINPKPTDNHIRTLVRKNKNTYHIGSNIMDSSDINTPIEYHGKNATYWKF